MPSMKNLLLILLLLALPLWGGKDGHTPVAEDGYREIVSNLFIGIETRPLTPEERRAHGAAIPRGSGLPVTRVVPGSPAEKGGMRDGDLILIRNGAPLDSPEALLYSLRNSSPGVPMTFRVLRGREMVRLTIVPEERPEPVVVGYMLPPRLNKDRVGEIRPLQIRAGRILAQDRVLLGELRSEMAAIHKLLNNSLEPGNLRLKFTTGSCTIIATKYPGRILVTMEEGGVETRCELLQEGDALPEAMRQRLRMMLGAEGAQE